MPYMVSSSLDIEVQDLGKAGGRGDCKPNYHHFGPGRPSLQNKPSYTCLGALLLELVAALSDPDPRLL